MTMQEPSISHSGAGRRIAAPLLRGVLAAMLGAAVALLIACGGTGAGLIPSGNAGPLQSDFEEVAQTARNGNGSCSATEAAILKTESDFRSLPAGVNGGLRNTLRKGISNLRSRALALCAQPLQQATVTSTTTKTTQTTATTPTTPTTTQTTPTQTTPTATTPTTTGRGGGTPAPGGEPPPRDQGGTEPESPAGGQEGGR
jgi:hypothetical protein